MRKTFIQTIIAVLICVFLVVISVTAVTVIFPTQGGTGISSYTTGDILYSDTTNSLAKLGIGSTDEVLTVAGGVPTWSASGAGAGDVLSVGDCVDGACLDGSSDGGTYIRLYDGDSNYAELNVGNIASNYIVYLPTSTGTLIHTEVDPTVDTVAEILAIIDDTALDFGTGVLTATGFSGPLTGAVTGNASTASALAADPANCGAGEYALGVDASGAVESCTDATTEINAVINGAGGTNLTCSSQTCNVDDSFIKLVGDTTGALTEDLNIDANIFVISYDDNKVGIGTASPNAPLEVKGAKPAGNVGGFQSGMFHVTGAGTDEFSNSVITGHSAYNTNTQLWYLGSTSSSDNDIAFINRQNAAIHFSTNNALKMIIEAAGDVGIGVTDPDTKLEILNAGDQLKLSFDGTDNTVFAVDTSGDLTITPSGTQIIVSGNISATNLSGTNTGDNDEVGTLTNTKWCTTDGSVVNCATNAPVLTEVDPTVDSEAKIEAITGALFGVSKVVTGGYIWVADGTDFESVAMSNDCTLASGGAITCDHDALDNFLAAEHVDWAGASAGTIHIDNYIENVSTALSVGTVGINTVAITSDGGADDVTLPAATVSAAGMLTTAKWAEIVANTAKATNVSTALSTGTVGATTYGITSDGGADDVIIAAATTDVAGMLTAAKFDEIVANTAKVTNATHTGDVTGSGALTIAADKVLESHLKAVDEAADEECLTYESTTGDFEWQSCGGTPTVITVADESADTTSFIAFFTAATGDLGPKTASGLTFNASTDILTATGFVGPLTGNVTGNVSGTALTVTQAAQSAITSLGTLTTLTVDDITINANSIVSAGASSLLITPTAGQTITFDGTITLDAGVIAGATSITSTSFVGALTGNASTATALATDPTTCTNQFVRDIAADGTLTCATVDISADTNLTAGRSLTMSADSVVADAELYTDTKCVYWEDPTADDDFNSLFYFESAATITRLWCESDQTVTMTLQEDDGSPADIETTDLTCDSTPADQTSGFEDAAMAAGSRIDFAVASVASTPTWCSFCFTFQYDD